MSYAESMLKLGSRQLLSCARTVTWQGLATKQELTSGETADHVRHPNLKETLLCSRLPSPAC